MKLELSHDLHLPTGSLALAATADCSLLYSACMDGRVYETNPATKAVTPFVGRHDSFASGCALLSDGKTLISGGFDGSLVWHDVESRQEIRRVKAHSFWSWRMALSPDGGRVASVTGQYLAGGEKYEPARPNEPTVKVYDTGSGDLLQEFIHLPPVLSVAFSPDGQHVAAANLMGDVAIWDVMSGEEEARFHTPDFTSWGISKSPYYCGGIYGLAFAPDGQTLLCCGMGPMGDPMGGNGKMTWQRWSWRNGAPELKSRIREGQQGAGLMETLAYHPGGKSFLMAGRQSQGTWTTAIFSDEGVLIASLDTRSRVTAARFAPDGSELYLSAAIGQPKRDASGNWPDYGRIHVVKVSA